MNTKKLEAAEALLQISKDLYAFNSFFESNIILEIAKKIADDAQRELQYCGQNENQKCNCGNNNDCEEEVSEDEIRNMIKEIREKYDSSN